ncbi:unnamed protein product [Soboliphyme baturini]|uniref:UBIQUITIN_CONJUGAT_2 domain-containing protein n=1 Tax=Soboliphyme baturini TaxID=241478 RepID=A0A183IR97_9BILA|nr:unnamed protein product [Soboliphyme baturini]
MCACLKKFKADLKFLQSLFAKDHERFRVTTSSLDEISCMFLCSDGQQISASASILENYPQTPPVWFSDSENPMVLELLSDLSQTSGNNNLILPQIQRLLSGLCDAFHLPVPQELSNFPMISEGIEKSPSQLNDLDSEDEEDYHYEMEEVDDTSKSKSDLAPEGVLVLNKLIKLQREQHLQGTVCGTVTATDHIYRSEYFKNGVYQFDLVNDNLYEWYVKLKRVDPDSQLAQDLVALKKKGRQDYILLHFIFPREYPYDPPFVHVVSPCISGGFVLDGGAICMELLTKQGWSSVYSIEAVILQIAATIVKCNAHVRFQSLSRQYSLVEAQESFKSLVHIHERGGWYTPPKEDG